MRPNRAAWFFAAGLTWLVLRGILAGSLPALAPAEIAHQGGWLLIIPALSLAASLTVPLFFASFLKFHRFVGQGALQAATVLALVASMLGFAMVLVTSLAVFGRPVPTAVGTSSTAPWIVTIVPFVVVGSLLAFMVTFWFQERGDPRLRLAAGIGALGALVSTVMALAVVLQAWSPNALPWYPAFSQSPSARLVGLAAAGALLWFLETFAVSYRDGSGDTGSV